MTTEQNAGTQKTQQSKAAYRGGASEAVYGFGMIGAWVYFISHATTFWVGALGVLTGIMPVYEALKALHM